MNQKIRKKYTGDMLTKAQRYVSLRIISGYRTVATSAALVVASLPPIDLLAVERKEVYESTKERERKIARNQEVPTPNERRAARLKLLSKWQERWNEETTGR